MKEDKQQICNLLAKTLRATRHGESLISIQLEEDPYGDELAHVYFPGYKTVVNVSGDSGLAMIRDIAKALY